MFGLSSRTAVILILITGEGAEDLMDYDESFSGDDSQDFLLGNTTNSDNSNFSDVPASAVSDGCARTTLGDTLYNKNPKIPSKKWLETPAVVKWATDHYQVFGRVVHLDYVKEQLQRKPAFLDFEPVRGNMDFKIRLDILADSCYLKGKVALHGIKLLNIFTREFICESGSQLDISSPNWNTEYARRIVDGENGQDGKHGFDGPKVELYADVIHGSFKIITDGANGQKGQDGGDGGRARDSAKVAADIPGSDCSGKSLDDCDRKPIPGIVGEKGPTGEPGGNAGHPGNGGNAGDIQVRYNRIFGKVELKSCKGLGASAAKNGKGGEGGKGGKGGRGMQCFVLDLDHPFCTSHGLVGRADNGPKGDRGRDGTTPSIPGTDGKVDQSMIRTGVFNEQSKAKFRARGRLLRAMFKRAEDFLLANTKDESGIAALKFIIFLSRGSRAHRSLRRAAKKKLNFIGKEGYDIFGKNKYFVPRLKWDVLKDFAEKTKKAAQTIEKAYNDIKSAVENNQSFKQVAKKLSKVAQIQVDSEQQRLNETRLIAQSERRLYIKGIRQMEEEMTSILQQVKAELKPVYEKAKFNANDLLAVLQGLTGFVSGAIGKDPGAFLGAAVGLASDLSGKSCLGSFQWNLAVIKKTMTFGEKFKPFKDSSNLNFDQFDVSAIPEIMQNNLDMNKEELTTQLVCMLDVASRPQDTAQLKKLIEWYFGTGSARIDLIAKVIDLDNDIGGYNFDIPILSDTKKSIAKLGEEEDASISLRLQQNFMENLLSTYERFERSFMLTVYDLQRSFIFRTLWEGTDLLSDFRRIARVGAAGTGRLNGMNELSKVLTKVEDLERSAVQCFSVNKYATGLKKWTFKKDKDTQMFKDLAKGSTKFTLSMKGSCKNCYNARLLKIYVELTGKQQKSNVPGIVYLTIRHLSGSFFRAGDDKIKEFRQRLDSTWNIKFDRDAVSNEIKCKQEKDGGNRQSSFCVNEGDTRLQPTCSSPLNGGKTRDRLLGEEECKSPFGTYELTIPVDKKLKCKTSGIQTVNCKDLDPSKFDVINVWTEYYLWWNKYPKGPDDPICGTPKGRKAKA